jgi:hypothetical protein
MGGASLACMGKMKNVYIILELENLNGRDRLGDLGTDEVITLKLLLQ